MVRITDKQYCSGCSACQQRCPKSCISMQMDNEGFLYPVANLAQCVNCGICEKVCHELHPYGERTPLKVYAAKNKNEEIRLLSSSGGLFSYLAEQIISKKGVVFGAKYDENWQVTFDYVDTIEDLSLFRGSKYVQARIDGSYLIAERFLKQGRFVLFSGTPCQIAGLHHFLSKTYENLYTVDILCHGVPSPKVWSLYLDETLGTSRNKIKKINFRDKTSGWNKYCFYLEYETEKEKKIIRTYHKDNLYMKIFLRDVAVRPSCYNCQAKQGRSLSDFTIADYWGIKEANSTFDDDKGTSLLTIQTEKGIRFLNFDGIDAIETSLCLAMSHNTGFNSILSPHHNRQIFFSKLGDCKSIYALIKETLELSSPHPIEGRHFSWLFIIKEYLFCKTKNLFGKKRS